MQQIKRKKLYEEVMTGIIDMVKTNAMTSGDKIHSEKVLCDLFGVSRMVIREALSALQSRDFVEVRHGSGIYLKEIDDLLYKGDLEFHAGKQQILNILELRRGLESEAAFLAATRSTPQDREELQQILQQMHQAISSGDKAGEEDYRFHSVLMNATHNPVYSKIFSEVITPSYYEVLKAGHHLFSKTFGPRLVIVQEHKLILDSIMAGRPVDARQAMWEHLGGVEAKIRKLFHL
ncbi:MAG: FadR/GntR family transcriptional regulator [Negativicutes bacterium]|nr:FadR/GntR family transcriptional regulator [Negativicutes bacterium]